MSGTPGLPLPQWTRWLTDEFTPLKRLVGVAVEDAADANSKLAELEARVEALEAPEEPPVEPEDPEEPGEPQERPRWSLLADPAFTPDSLSPEGQKAHARLLAYLANVRAQRDQMGSGGANGVRGYARQGDTYQLARPVRTVATQLFAAFAATGDPSILDGLGVICDDMRGALKPGWRGTQAVPAGCPGGDGYVEPGSWRDGIWVFQQSGADRETGRDVHLSNDQKAQSVVAMYAALCRANEHLDAKYEAAHKYWRSELEAWEKSWRSNHWGRRNTVGPIFRRGGFHSTHGEALSYELLSLYHRVALEPEELLTSVPTAPPYTLQGATQKEIDRHGEAYYRGLRDDLLGEIWAGDFVPTGGALVWRKSIQAIDPGDGDYAHPLTYARYVFEDALLLHILGVPRYGEDTMRRLARTLTEHVILQPASGAQSIVTARDVTGGTNLGGISASDANDWRGLNNLHWTAWAGCAALERWDDTGRLAEFNQAAYDAMGWGDDARGVAVPVAQLIAATTW